MGREFGHLCAVDEEQTLSRREEPFSTLVCPSLERSRKIIPAPDAVNL